MINKNKSMAKKQEVYQDVEPGYKNEDDFMNDWVFHYNTYSKQWAAIPRDYYNEYWNNFKHPEVLRSKHMNTLLSLLYKAKGNKDIIEDITSGEIK